MLPLIWIPRGSRADLVDALRCVTGHNTEVLIATVLPYRVIVAVKFPPCWAGPPPESYMPALTDRLWEVKPVHLWTKLRVFRAAPGKCWLHPNRSVLDESGVFTRCAAAPD